MKVFLWEGVRRCSTSYHSGGSVLIRASDLSRARELGIFKDEIDETIFKMSGLEEQPDAIFDSESNEETVWIFPNAGCC